MYLWALHPIAALQKVTAMVFCIIYSKQLIWYDLLSHMCTTVKTVYGICTACGGKYRVSWENKSSLLMPIINDSKALYGETFKPWRILCTAKCDIKNSWVLPGEFSMFSLNFNSKYQLLPYSAFIDWYF